MTPADIQNNLQKLENLMYGHNYEVWFNLTLFDNCFTINYAQKRFEEVYKDMKVDRAIPTLVDKEDFWQEVNYGLTYRGDYGAGLSVSKDKESELDKEQLRYKEFIDQFMTYKTKIYSYPYSPGVFWDYCFLLLAGDKCLFVFGAASD